MILPNLIIAGALKSGTSSVHFWLEAHPETHGSKRKDSFFLGDKIVRFNEGLSYINDGLEGYEKLFNKNLAKTKKIVFESTATYIYYKNTPKIVADMPTKPKVVFILRNPVKRLVSHYLFEKHRTKRVKNVSLSEYLKEPKQLEQGYYVNYLKHWERHIGRDRMIVFIFEEFMADPAMGMKQLASEIGIDSSFYDDFDFTVRNETVRIRSSWLHQLGLKVQPLVPARFQELVLPLYLKINSGGKPSLNKSEREIFEKEVKPVYTKAKVELEEFLGRNIEHWS